MALDPRGRPGRGRLGPAAPAVGARRDRLGVAPGPGAERSSAGARPTAPSSIRARELPRWRGPTRTTFGKIFRRNVAYGTVARHGTIFVGFSGDQRILAGDAREHDRTRAAVRPTAHEVTRPLTGAYYVIPSADALAARGEDRRAEDPEAP